MPIVEELARTTRMPIRMYRQLRLAGVRTAEEMYAFIVAFPSLVYGEGRLPGVWRAGLDATRAPPRGIAFVDLFTDLSRRRAATLGARAPLLLNPLEVARETHFYATLGWARARCRPAFLAFAREYGTRPLSLATGAETPPDGPGAGRVIPMRALSSPLRRFWDAPTGRIIDYEVKFPPGMSFPDFAEHGGIPPTAGVGSGGGMEGWESPPISIAPLGNPVAVTLPAEALWRVRDQGTRGTCCAHAAVASAEHLLASITNTVEDLSEEYLFDVAAGLGATSTRMLTVQQALADAKKGVCKESLDPYVSNANALLSAPTPTAKADGKARRFRGTTTSWESAKAVYAVLKRGRVAAMSLPVFEDPNVPGSNNWNTDVGLLYGRVLGAPAGAVQSSSAHAVCTVRYADPNVNGGWFVFRNSWGAAWGQKHDPDGPTGEWRNGYGYVSAAYVDAMLIELMELRNRL